MASIFGVFVVTPKRIRVLFSFVLLPVLLELISAEHSHNISKSNREVDAGLGNHCAFCTKGISSAINPTQVSF